MKAKTKYGEEKRYPNRVQVFPRMANGCAFTSTTLPPLPREIKQKKSEDLKDIFEKCMRGNMRSLILVNSGGVYLCFASCRDEGEFWVPLVEKGNLSSILLWPPPPHLFFVWNNEFFTFIFSVCQITWFVRRT
jgi:hypothetical protein